MVRRKPYTKVVKSHQVRAAHVEGMGDVVFKGFQCLNSDCEVFIFIRKDELGDDFEIICPSCGTVLQSGGETKFYDYKLLDLRNNSKIESGKFAIPHDDYIAEAQEYKYCIICNTMKPLTYFDRHAARKSGRQGECNLCKGIYNNIKNQTRISDQHREAAQKRRLYLDLAGTKKINISEIFDRFNHCCFKCKKHFAGPRDKNARLDHTLPVLFLWPLTSENATLLCKKHNGEKSGKWPSHYYSKRELKQLAVVTGISYDVLSGPSRYNPEAIKQLKTRKNVNFLLQKYAPYMSEIIKLRNRILRDEGFDFFKNANISEAWVREAKKTYRKVLHQSGSVSTEQDIDAK
jgi:hypothetical protein